MTKKYLKFFAPRLKHINHEIQRDIRNAERLQRRRNEIVELVCTKSIKERTGEIETLKQELDRRQAEADQLKSQLEQTQEENQKLISELKTIECEVKKLRAEITDREVELKRINERNDLSEFDPNFSSTSEDPNEIIAELEASIKRIRDDELPQLVNSKQTQDAEYEALVQQKAELEASIKRNQKGLLSLTI